MNIVSIPIPDLLNYPFTTQMVQLGNQLYFFQFFWNIRHSRAYLSIYTKKNEELYYLVKNICLTPSIVISQHIQDTDWNGTLIFAPILDGIEEDYRQDNINTEFDIKYTTEE